MKLNQPSAIRIGSSTLAMRGCEILKKNGIGCEVRKTSDNGGRYGCMYAIYVSPQQRWKAESLLRNAGIMILP